MRQLALFEPNENPDTRQTRESSVSSGHPFSETRSSSDDSRPSAYEELGGSVSSLTPDQEKALASIGLGGANVRRVTQRRTDQAELALRNSTSGVAERTPDDRAAIKAILDDARRRRGRRLMREGRSPAWIAAYERAERERRTKDTA